LLQVVENIGNVVGINSHISQKLELEPMSRAAVLSA
jgi:hypothetical protein